MIGLTKRQGEAFEFICAHLKAHGFAPTVSEIITALGLSPTCKQHCTNILQALEERGRIRRRAKCWRGIQLIETEQNHATDCSCRVCTYARYLAQRKLVEAIQAPVPAHLISKLRGLAPVSELTKVYWLRGFPLSLKPRRSAA